MMWERKRMKIPEIDEEVKNNEYIEELIKEGRSVASRTNNLITIEDLLYILSKNEELSQRMAICFYVGVAKGLSIAEAKQDGKALQ